MTITQQSPSLTTQSAGATAPDGIATIPFTHERVLFTTGLRSGLVMSVAVHSTRLGQALGGARVWQYSDWTEAVADSLRLSAAMTLKNAAAGLNRGGGKSVVHLRWARCSPTPRSAMPCSTSATPSRASAAHT